jgi:predicted nucleic-acid-binding protein
VTPAFLDPNIVLRFLIDEHTIQHRECVRCFVAITDGLIRPYTSNIVIAEIHYVLIKLYKQPKASVVESIETLLKVRNISIIEKSDTPQAIAWYKVLNLKFGDCLIATQVPKGVTLLTYDRDFEKIPSLVAKTPGEFLSR